jgi:hypothetical protein
MVNPVEICPLCGEALPEVGSPDRDNDHVFGQAYGGRVTVPTHKICNNSEGSGAEGSLARPIGLMNLIRSFHGLATLPVPVVAADGTKFNVDFADGEMTRAKPEVKKVDFEDSIQLSAKGSEQQLRGVLRDWKKGFGAQIPAFDQIPPESRGQATEPAVEVNAELVLDLEAAERFALNVALDAGLLAFGPAFATSELAVAMREYKEAPFDNPLVPGVHHPRMLPQDLEGLDYALRNIGVSMAADLNVAAPDLPPLVPPPEERMNSVTFVPRRDGHRSTTAVFVHTLSFPLPPWGIVIDAPLPPGPIPSRSGPVVVQEGSKPWRTIDWTKELLSPVLAAAQRSAAESEREFLADREQGDESSEGNS